MLKASKRETPPKMRSLILYGVRAQKDDLVDRPEVEVQQCMQLTGTNSPRA